MSLKGHKFVREDLPRITQQRLKSKQVEAAPIDEYLDRLTDRYAIVAMDGETPIIAEELNERLMRRSAEMEDGTVDGDVLSCIRRLMQLTQDQRSQVLNAFDEDGELVNEFDPPPEEEKPAKKTKK